MSALADVRRAWRACRREAGPLLVFSGVFNLLLLTPSLYMLQVYDRVMVSRSELTLLAVSLLAAGLLGLLAVADASRARLLARWVAGLDRRLGPRLLAASFALALRREQGERQADSAEQPLRDWARLKRFLQGPGLPALLDAPWSPVFLVVLFLLHPALGILGLVFMAVQAALAWLGHRRLVQPKRQAEQAQARAAEFVQAKLRSAELITALGMTGDLLAHWQARHERGLQAQAGVEALGHRVAAWSKGVRYSQQSLGLGAGALLVIQGELSAGAMIAATFLLVRALTPIDQLAGIWPALIEAIGALRRLRGVGGPAAEVAAGPDGLRGQVLLTDVAVQLPGRAAPLLAGVNLQAGPGSLTLLLGPSGSGKSTLARVVVGLWPPARGEARIDGRVATDWAAEGWQGQLGYLPQEVLLFQGTVAENIARMGRPDPARVIAAARDAGLHQAILALPQGYDTPVGEGGSHLSGGLRQRIALARALYGGPNLVVLDEPHAQLDEAGETALAACLAQLKARGATVLLIAHRPALQALADQVLQLHGGAAALRPVAATDGPQPVAPAAA